MATKASTEIAQARLFVASERHVRQLSIGGTRTAARCANSPP